ncbi:MAG: ImmA/IrrE family metallo-endopeptidase [Methylocella sp.]
MSKLSDLLQSNDIHPGKLSTKTGIPVARIHALAAEAEPTVGELRRLADALKVSITDFAPASSAKDQQADLLFRRAAVAGKPVPSAALQGLSRKMSCSFDLLGAGRRQIGPWWLRNFERGEDTHQSAERNAAIFRRIFCNDDQLRPLVSLPNIVVDQMETMLFVIRSPDLDGASAYLDGIPFVFVSARFPSRMLFTLAHECGHLVSHHDARESFAVVDETTGSEDNTSLMEASIERYANAFASALLMPRESIGVALKKIREIAKINQEEVGDLEIGYLARIFGVSFWAAARRCEDLALLPRGGAASLNEELVREYGSAEKRADQAGLPPRPEVNFPPVPRALLASAVERIRAGEVSIGRAATILGLSIGDLMAANASTVH